MKATKEFRYVASTNIRVLFQNCSGCLHWEIYIPCLSLNIHRKPTEEIIHVNILNLNAIRVSCYTQTVCTMRKFWYDTKKFYLNFIWAQCRFWRPIFPRCGQKWIISAIFSADHDTIFNKKIWLQTSGYVNKWTDKQKNVKLSIVYSLPILRIRHV